MVSRRSLVGGHRRFHSRIPQFKSIPETIQHTTTVQELEHSVVLSPRSTQTHVDSSVGGFDPTIPIAVGICVPVVIIIVTFIWLHRRHVKKMRAEERSDPHKSLDFGMMIKSNSAKGNARQMAQVDFEKSLRKGRGLSLDVNSPYLLPPELQNSRESLNTISRNPIHEAHDPYRIVSGYVSQNSSARNSAVNDDNMSVRTASTRNFGQDRSPLVPNAQRMPFSSSPVNMTSGTESPKPDSRSQSRSPLASPPQASTPNMDNFVPPAPIELPGLPEKSMARNSPKPPSPPQSLQPQQYQLPELAELPHAQSIPSPVPQITVGNNNEHYDEHYDNSHHEQQSASQHRNLASPNSAVSEQFYTPTEETHDPYAIGQATEGLGLSDVNYDSHRLSVLRPLPPDDPSETPAQRAMRIRSFYKEYFNDNEMRVYQEGPNEYYEDYGSEYLGDGAIYDPHAGQFIVGQAPYAEPITRRAMTPPPRGPPRFRQGSRQTSTGSAPGGPYNRARAFSTASAGNFRGRQPRRNAPPPAPLRTLPTPHLLKEDAFALPIDFAPPGKIRDQAAGRAPSPKMEPRPFSPAVAIASPLASSFMEMPAMPSPHHLRRSGTFTALDFAPPPRFKDRGDGGSDAGSVRSGRSNHSTSSRMQVHNIRAGAYRVSRIPKELVASHGDFKDILKPTWKVGS